MRAGAVQLNSTDDFEQNLAIGWARGRSRIPALQHRRPDVYDWGSG